MNSLTYGGVRGLKLNEYLCGVTIGLNIHFTLLYSMLNSIPTNSENIDDLLVAPLKDFMNNLQTCDFGCCGIGGMSLNPEDIKNALKNHDKAELLKIILKLQLQIRQIAQPFIISRFLNDHLHKSELLDILKFFRNTINDEIRVIKPILDIAR